MSWRVTLPAFDITRRSSYERLSHYVVVPTAQFAVDTSAEPVRLSWPGLDRDGPARSSRFTLDCGPDALGRQEGSRRDIVPLSVNTRPRDRPHLDPVGNSRCTCCAGSAAHCPSLLKSGLTRLLSCVKPPSPSRHAVTLAIHEGSNSTSPGRCVLLDGSHEATKRVACCSR